jgi:predicted TIM-barrel fold metal-dependent hydrolase
MTNDKKLIHWIEDMGLSSFTRELRQGIEQELQGVEINPLYQFDWVWNELRCGDNGLWVIDSGFPHHISGLVERIKKEHPYAKIIVYHLGEGQDSHPQIDAQVDITQMTPKRLAEVVSKYLN